MRKINLLRSQIVKSLMRTLIIIETEISFQPQDGFSHRLIIFQKDFFVFDRSPESFNKDIVKDPASTVHTDMNSCPIKDVGKIKASKLRALISIKDIGPGSP